MPWRAWSEVERRQNKAVRRSGDVTRVESEVTDADTIDAVETWADSRPEQYLQPHEKLLMSKKPEKGKRKKKKKCCSIDRCTEEKGQHR